MLLKSQNYVIYVECILPFDIFSCKFYDLKQSD